MPSPRVGDRVADEAHGQLVFIREGLDRKPNARPHLLVVEDGPPEIVVDAIASLTGTFSWSGDRLAVVRTVVMNATVIVGAAAGTITNCNAQLFSGTATPTALGTQTTNVTSTPFTENSAFTFTWAAPGVLVTPANAPNRFVYFSLGLTDSVAPSFAAASVPIAINVAPSAFGTSAPILAAKYTGGGATQPATLVSPTTVAAAMLVWLT